MNKLIRASVIAGSVIFAIAFLAMLVQEAIVALLVITIFPGPVFAIILLLYSGKQAGWRVLLFFLLATALYYGVVTMLNPRQYDESYFAGRLLMGGVGSFLLLQVLYQALLGSRTWKVPLLRTGLAGLLATLPAALGAVVTEGPREALYWPSLIGLFAVFPLWQYLFAREVVARDPSAAKVAGVNRPETTGLTGKEE